MAFPLHTLSSPRPITQAMFDASRATVMLLIEHGSADLPISRIAQHAGISERSFYRYFPRKEDALRPFLQTGLHRIVDNFNARPAGEPVITSLLAAWSDAWPLKERRSSAVLYRILEQHDSYRALRLQVIIDSETLWSEALALRLGIEPCSAHALFVGAAVVAAFRMTWQACSLDASLDPHQTLQTNFQVFSDVLLNPSTVPRHALVHPNHNEE
jgi:AcrR family transcriptional regulator